MLEATLHKKIAKAIDHQGIRLSNDRFDNLVLLLRGSDFQLLLQEDGGLLVVVADNLVNDILPVAAHIAI